MAKPKIELDISGLREVMKSGEAQAALQAAGNAVANAAGGDYGVRVHLGSFVAIANVYPNSKEAAKKNFEENTLLKACGSAGLPMK